MHACEDVISSSAAGSPPKASLRELVKHTSDAGGEDTHVVAQEREYVWRRADPQLKAWIFVVYVQSETAVGIAGALKKASGSGAFRRDLKGVVNENNCAFVLSSDLLHENISDLWLNSSDPPPRFS